MSRHASPAQSRDASSASPSPAAPPPPPPWAFAAAYSQPLPPSLRFDPHTGFTAMTDYIDAASQNQPTNQLPRVNPLVATYKDRKNKAEWFSMAGLSRQEKKEYQRGNTVTGASKNWRAAGTVGLVTSSMSSASEQSGHQNDWHTVAMARHGSNVWVHDPAYNSTAHAGTVKRVDGVRGTRNVHQLIQQWPNVQGVYFQGPPSSYLVNPGQMECMGRSTQWVEATLNGTLPWPPNADSSGGQWTFHYRN